MLSAGIVLEPASSRAMGSFLDPARGLVVAGKWTTDLSLAADFALLRYDANGNRDSSFGGDGLVTTTLSKGTDIAWAVAPYGTDKILAAGQCEVTGANPNYNFALVRYKASDGSLDTSFGSKGKVVTDLGGNDIIRSLAVDQDTGNIYVVASTVLARYTSSGQLDTSFNGTGIVPLPLQAEAVAWSSGRVFIAGAVNTEGGTNEEFYDLAVACYTTSGGLDKSFGSDGLATSRLPGFDYGYGIALDARGIYVVGDAITYRSANWSSEDAMVVRFTANGGLDTGFDSDGRVLVNIDNALAAENGRTSDEAHGVAVDASGRIVVAARAAYSGPGQADDWRFAAFRLTPGGALDATFHGDGIAVTDLADSSIPHHADPKSIALHGNKVIVSGWDVANDPSTRAGRAAIVRYNDDGTIDSTFGNNAPPTPAVSISNASKTEGNRGTTSMQFTVSLAQPATWPVIVSYATADYTATAGSDYVAASGYLTIPVGALSASLTVSIKGDTVAEGGETFYVNLSAYSGAVVAQSQGVGTIVDDDAKSASTSRFASGSAIISDSDLYGILAADQLSRLRCQGASRAGQPRSLMDLFMFDPTVI